MELEDKIKKLEEQFKGLPKVLIKRALCGDDVNEDISKAMDRLREFQQIKNPMAATPVKEELRGSLYVPPAEELDINSVTKSCIVEGTETAVCRRTGGRKATDPPKPKPKPNRRKLQENDEDRKDTRDPTFPLCSPTYRPYAQSNSPPPPTYRRSTPTQLLPQAHATSVPHRQNAEMPPPPTPPPPPPPTPSPKCSTTELPPPYADSEPPPPPPQRGSTSEPHLPHAYSTPPSPSPNRWSTFGSSLPHTQSAPPQPLTHRWSTSELPLPHAQSTPPKPSPDRWSTPPRIAEHALPPPRASIKKCVHSEVTGSKERKESDAALETSKATNNNVQEEQMELEEKIKMLKEEFSSLPRVLIKKTLCDDAVDGDVTKAKQRLMEFKHQNPGGAGRDTGKLNRGLDRDSSPVIRPAKIANIDFEEQSLPGRGNTMRQNSRRATENDEDCKDTRDPIFLPSAIRLPTPPPPSRYAQSTSPPPRTYEQSTPRQSLPQAHATSAPHRPYAQTPPPPMPPHECSTTEPPLSYAQSEPLPPPPPPLTGSTSEPPLPHAYSTPPPPSPHRGSTLGSSLPHTQSAPPQPLPHRWSTSEPPLPHAQSTPPPPPPPPDRSSTSPRLAEHALPPPRASIKKCVHSEVTGNKGRKDNDAALETSKATNNNVQEEQMELEEKIKTLKGEFSSLPRVLIKKTLCDDAVDGDVTKAKQRLMEFKHQNPGGAGRDAGKLKGDLDSFRLTKIANIDFEEKTLSGRENMLPRNWIPMPRDDRGKDVDVHLVKLASSSAEYQEVVERLQETVASDLMIQSVERIQNPYLYQAYQLRKQKMDRDNPEADNERQLFHGTNSNNVKKINTQGFDRSFTGSAHGAVYGTGVYFARDASYSMHYTGGSHQVLYLARVLVGRYCQGSSKIKKPPPINPEQPEILFDSMVNKITDPSIFVVYYDNQSYPEYLITI